MFENFFGKKEVEGANEVETIRSNSDYTPDGDINVQKTEAERLKDELEALWLQLPSDPDVLSRLFAENFKPGWEGRVKPFQTLFDKIDSQYTDDDTKRKAYRALGKDFQRNLEGLRLCVE